MAKPRDPRRAALGLPDAAQVVREQLDPATRRQLDVARRVAFYRRQHQALIRFEQVLQQRERASRPRSLAADRGRLERYRNAKADPEVTTRKELARKTEPGWSTQALRDFECRNGLTGKK